MIFVPTPIEGVVVVEPQPHADERGFFARTFCAREFEAAGLSPVVAQTNVSFNHRAGTFRGLHFQRAPAQEAKLVRCTRGRVYEVAVDVRPLSPTYLRHVGVVLCAEQRNALYVGEGCANGYLTLEDDCEVTYSTSAAYAPELEQGVRWDDPALDIEWLHEVRMVSAKDAGWPLIGAKPETM